MLHTTPDQCVSLHEFRGRPIIMAFYPADWSPVCGDQLTLVEYGDYKSPHCGQVHPVVKQLLLLLGRRLCFVFRHFPLTTVHPHAQLAAEAAEAAGTQGKFWQMHNVLFEHQQALDTDDLVRCAAALDLDIYRFGSELASHVHAARVREDFLSGVRSGVNGTPTFFINSVRHDGSYDFDTLLNAIEGAMTVMGPR
jgi:protein-disulfide isomerase